MQLEKAAEEEGRGGGQISHYSLLVVLCWGLGMSIYLPQGDSLFYPASTMLPPSLYTKQSKKPNYLGSRQTDRKSGYRFGGQSLKAMQMTNNVGM